MIWPIIGWTPCFVRVVLLTGLYGKLLFICRDGTTREPCRNKCIMTQPCRDPHNKCMSWLKKREGVPRMGTMPLHHVLQGSCASERSSLRLQGTSFEALPGLMGEDVPAILVGCPPNTLFLLAFEGRNGLFDFHTLRFKTLTPQRV